MLEDWEVEKLKELAHQLDVEFDPAVPTVANFLSPLDKKVEGLVETVDSQLAVTMKKREAQWLAADTPPTDVLTMLKLDEAGDQLLVKMTTFRWIDYVDRYNEKHPLQQTTLLAALMTKGYDKKTLIKLVFSPEMQDKMVERLTTISDSIIKTEDRGIVEEALLRQQHHAKTRLTNNLIEWWLYYQKTDPDIVGGYLGLLPNSAETGFDFSRFKA